MADPTTLNTSMSVPIRGTDVGTWDVPVNGNFNIIDSMFGGVTILTPTNAPITLTSSQAQNSIIRLTGTLTGNVAITMGSINKFWTIDNQLTNSPSSFAVTFVSTGGASIIGAPPGMQDFYYDGTTLRYKGLDRVGSYWDYAGTTVPTWVSACTVPPYLNCNGTAFSSATYPILANLIGTTLPDARGRVRAILNQGSSRITSSNGGLDGNTIFAGAGTDTTVLGTSNLPPYTPSGSVTTTPSNNLLTNNSWQQAAPQSGNALAIWNGTAPTFTSVFTGNAQGGVSNPFPSIQPSYVGGITMIRAA